MSRNGRARRNSDCTAGGPRPTVRAPHQRRRGEGAEQAFVIGILTSAADFARARAWGLSNAADHEQYLAETAELLADALERFDTVRARMFHPQDFAEFCVLHGLDRPSRSPATATWSIRRCRPSCWPIRARNWPGTSCRAWSGPGRTG